MGAIFVNVLPSQVSSTAVEKPYTIQLVTYRKKELADAEIATVRKMGYTAYIDRKGEYLQVCAGQYATKDTAKRDLATFQKRYEGCFLRHR